MQNIAVALVVCFWIASPRICDAQKAPEGWRWQLDQSSTGGTQARSPEGSLSLQEMVPGMHVTTGPGVVLLAPGAGAIGRFMVDAEMLLFPNSSDGGYGIIVGGRPRGRSLDIPAAYWVAFVVSGDGRFAVVQHTPERTTLLVDWRSDESIVRRAKDVVTNRLRVAVEPDSVRFVVNQKQLAALSRALVQPDGLFGLRIDEGLNLHVTNVDIARRLLKRK